MSVQVEKLEKSMAKLTIEIPAFLLDEAIEKAYHKTKGKISIPGFRKGKVPRHMIEKMYGKEIFYDEAANELIPIAYENALNECTEEIVSSPQIEVIRIEAGEPFVFTAEVALKPDIKLGKYKGVKVTKQDSEVTEQEITAVFDKERERNARNVVIEDRPVKDGDMTILDFEGFVDEVPFPGGKGEDHALTIGSGSFVPGFEAGLIGAEIGKETDVNVVFPADYKAAELAGKPAVFKCTVKEIKEKELPELDDEFASEVSEFETLAEYKEDVKAKLMKDKEKAAEEAKEDAVIDAIISDSDIEIPMPMLETQQRQIVEEFARNIQMQGIKMEQYLEYTGMTKEMMIAQMAPQADKRIRTRLVLEAVVAAENIAASEEDFEEEVKKMAEIYRMEVDKVRKMMSENDKDQIMKDLAVKKAIDFVVANAQETK